MLWIDLNYLVGSSADVDSEGHSVTRTDRQTLFDLIDCSFCHVLLFPIMPRLLLSTLAIDDFVSADDKSGKWRFIVDVGSSEAA